jgi:A/G-specific adenine glycosylase
MCEALRNNTISNRPVKKSKTKIRDRFFSYSIFQESDEIIVQKREKKDIWQHLYEFPLLESDERLTEIEIIELLEKKYQLKSHKISVEHKHILSHQHIYARFVHFDKIPYSLKPLKIRKTDLQSHPLPRLIDKYLENSL